MQYSLMLYPGFECDAVTSIEVRIRASDGMLLLEYRLIGTMSQLSLPPKSSCERADRLWEHTCLEAFLRARGSSAYYELNFAPSTQWAAYRLEDYRSGMMPFAATPSIEVALKPDELMLQAALHLPPDAGDELGLSAVIEEKSGRKSYWTLAHSPGAPDFHHKDCFAARLPEMTAP
jgi:hypothetical protein